LYAHCASDVQGLKRKLSSKLSVVGVEGVDDWQVNMGADNDTTNCSVTPSILDAKRTQDVPEYSSFLVFV
jgi:hypothetical protein